MDKKVKETAAQVQTSILSSIYSSFTTAKTVRFDDWRLGSLYTALVILIVPLYTILIEIMYNKSHVARAEPMIFLNTWIAPPGLAYSLQEGVQNIEDHNSRNYSYCDGQSNVLLLDGASESRIKQLRREHDPRAALTNLFYDDMYNMSCVDLDWYSDVILSDRRLFFVTSKIRSNLDYSNMTAAFTKGPESTYVQGIVRYGTSESNATKQAAHILFCADAHLQHRPTGVCDKKYQITPGSYGEGTRNVGDIYFNPKFLFRLANTTGVLEQYDNVGVQANTAASKRFTGVAIALELQLVNFESGRFSAEFLSSDVVLVVRATYYSYAWGNFGATIQHDSTRLARTGIDVRIKTSGSVGYFSPSKLINLIVNAAVLLGFAKTIVDLFAEHLLPESSSYIFHKYEIVGDLTQCHLREIKKKALKGTKCKSEKGKGKDTLNKRENHEIPMALTLAQL